MQHFIPPFTIEDLSKPLTMEEFRRWQAKCKRNRIALATIRAVERYISTPEGKEKLEARTRAKKEKEEKEND